MSTEELERVVQNLQAEIARLNARLSELEAHEEAPQPEAAPAAPQARALVSAAEEAIPEEVLLAISAAVAAYLGERAHVRAVRLISTTRWSQQGRVSIQASHSLERG